MQGRNGFYFKKLVKLVCIALNVKVTLLMFFSLARVVSLNTAWYFTASANN
jgi:hypothetical protein